jgi:SAM-dependent methyltransferase
VSPSSTPQRPLPPEIDAIARGYWASRVLLTAIELDLFTIVGGGAAADDVAARAGTQPATTARLLNALVGLELLAKNGERFACTPAAREFLAAGGPDDSRASLRHLANLWERWSTLTDCVRTGARVTGPQRSDDPGWTAAFIGAMHRGSGLRAPGLVSALAAEGLLAGRRRVLDVGGGSGVYCHAFLAALPEARATLFDLAEVVDLARGYAEAAGLAARMDFLAGDLREGRFGQGYDVALVSAICHMLNPADNAALLTALRTALAPGGLLVISDFILDEDRARPAFASLFGINMLVGTGGGDSYAESDYRAWLEAAGYGQIRRLALPGPAQLMVAQAG